MTGHVLVSACALLAAAYGAAVALPQDAPPPVAPPAAAPAAPVPDAAPAKSALKEPFALGATFDTLRFREVAAAADGRRTQFDPIAKEVAFEVWLEGAKPIERKVAAAEPGKPAAGDAASAPVATTLVTPIFEVLEKEWDDYHGYLMSIAPAGDEVVFTTILLNELVEHKAALLSHYEDLPDLRRRVAAAVEKLEAGERFARVVRTCSEDETTRAAGGFCIDDDHSGFLGMYPYARALLDGTKPGDILQPILTRNACYILEITDQQRFEKMSWRDRTKANGVCIRFSTGKGMSAQQSGMTRSFARVRTDKPRFIRMIPPGLQEPQPRSFGPDDVAPIGTPAKPLSQRSFDDAKDRKVPAPAAPPAPPASGGN